jgi:hypothetical protein
VSDTFYDILTYTGDYLAFNKTALMDPFNEYNVENGYTGIAIVRHISIRGRFFIMQPFIKLYS